MGLSEQLITTSGTDYQNQDIEKAVQAAFNPLNKWLSCGRRSLDVNALDLVCKQPANRGKSHTCREWAAPHYRYLPTASRGRAPNMMDATRSCVTPQVVPLAPITSWIYPTSREWCNGLWTIALEHTSGSAIPARWEGFHLIKKKKNPLRLQNSPWKYLCWSTVLYPYDLQIQKIVNLRGSHRNQELLQKGDS